MTAVAVEISSRPPLAGGGPAGTGAPYFTRPVLEPVMPVTTVTGVADLDTVMDGARCSCAAGDDNPH
ncbi:hypothetical protein [Streptomyces flavalbus]|uniref:Uncharacterized protein n=1 Tax=Streptomyces flavalbus TaxID=2665155 RepID=A0ABW2W8S9_9ACTN